MGKAALGSLLKIEDDASAGVFNTIGGVENLSGPNLSLDTVEVTDQDSTWEEVVASILRTGEVSADINFDQANETTHKTLLNKMANKTQKIFRITFSDDDTTATNWDFDAFVTGFQPTANTADKLTAAITLKPTGQPTLNYS
jgi:predicted secreted protein